MAIDPNTGELRPFQVVTQRRGRKYKIEEKVTEIPVILVLFDILYLEGKTLIDFPYLERREILEKIVTETENIQITHPRIVDNPDELNKLMENAIETGCEGLVIKSMAPSLFTKLEQEVFYG